MTTASTVETIRAVHRERIYQMNQRMRIYAALGAHLRGVLGWTPDLPKAMTTAIKKRAAALIVAGSDPEDSMRRTIDYKTHKIDIETTIQAAGVFASIEKIHTKRLEDLAQQLPVWAWAKDVRGFGPSSLATIIGETGDLSNYSAFCKVWKRLGLAVMDGIRQGGLPQGSAAEDWIEHGYDKVRRSRMFVVGECMLRNNKGVYKTAYDKRKKHETKRAKASGLKIAASADIPEKRKDQYMSFGHIHRRSQRYMEKMLVRDLWKAWKRCEHGIVELKEAA